MYRLIFFDSKPLVRDKKKLQKDKKSFEMIQEGLGRLAVDPFAKSLNVKKLNNFEEGVFRLRCGSWRVIFDVDTANKIIVVYRIMQRKEGY